MGETCVRPSEPHFQAVLAHAYARSGHPRPRCACTPDGAEMYVTRIGGAFHLKRMPGQGSAHAWTCPSFEPPAQLSGLGQLQGRAIKEDPADGTTALRLGFSLTRQTRRAPHPGAEPDEGDATHAGVRLSLRGLLHLLWEDAGFNSWSPGMAGKRNWAVLRRHLLAAAERKRCRNGPLEQWLFLPEVWDEVRREEIAARRRARFLSIATVRGGPRRLLLVLGEVRRLEPARYGHRLVIKHAPDVGFEIDDGLYAVMRRQFATELSQWEAEGGARDRGGHLMVLGTFSVALSGRPSLEALTLMTVTSTWIPVEDAFDAEVVTRLVGQGRRFTRCLRYNLAPGAPIACAVTSDPTGPVAHFIVRPGVSEAYEARLAQLIADSGLASWVWRPAEGPPPPLEAVAPPAPTDPVTPPAFDPFGEAARSPMPR